VRAAVGFQSFGFSWNALVCPPGDQRAKEAIKTDVWFVPGDDGRVFLKELDAALVGVLSTFRPDFVLYNAGTDCLEGDPLGGLDLSPESIVARDEVVFRACLGRHPALSLRTPVAMVLSGGYQRVTSSVIARSLLNLNEAFGLFNTSL
jgi:histone deacetylase 11